MKSARIFLLSFFLITPFIVSADKMAQEGFEYDIEEPKSWVKKIKVRTARDKTDDTNISWLLSNKQLLMKKDKVESFNHYALQVNLESGLKDGSEFSMYYQPDFQSLEINFIKRYRNGKTTTITDKADIRLLQREEGFSEGIYDGGVTAIALLKDIQVGDIVEYGYTIIGRNPIFSNEYFASFATNWSIPVERTYIKLITDKDVEYQLHGMESDQVKKERIGGEYHYTWDQPTNLAIYDEGQYPHWYNPYGVLRFSQYDSWQGVVDWAIDLYKLPELKNLKLLELAKSWSATSKSKKDYAEKVIRYAQNNIRYFGIEIGQNSHRPYNPDVVFERKFGDCKDKVMFINSLLALEGIEAYPALVSSRSGKAVADRIPQPGAFDHVISTFEIDGKTYWLDGTRQFQYGSLENIGVGNFEKALVIKPGEKALTTMDNVPKQDAIYIRENYVSQNYNEPVELKAVFEYHYSNAESSRQFLESEGVANFSKNYENYYSRQYPGIRLKNNAQTIDDEENNTFVVKIDFIIENYWKSKNNQFEVPLYGDLISSYIEKPSVASRTMPLATYYPIKLFHSIEVEYGNDISWDLDDKDVSIVSDEIDYLRKIKLSSKAIKVTHSFNTKKDHVANEKVADYLQKTNEIRKSIFYSVFIPDKDGLDGQGENLKNSIRRLLKKNRS